MKGRPFGRATTALLAVVASVAFAAAPLTAAAADPTPSVAPTLPTSPVAVCPVAVSPDATASRNASSPLAKVAEAPPPKPVGSWEGTWAPMPTAPISARSGAATGYAVWDDRMYVWGGRDADGSLLNDGGVFLIRDQTWQTLPESPLVPREHFGFDADSLGMTVWGGVDPSGQPLGDGAQLELGLGEDETMSWTILPPAPLTPGPASLSGGIGTTYAVTPGVEPGDPRRFAVLDDDRGELAWDDPSSPDIRTHGKMPAPPVPAGIAFEIASSRQTAVLLSYHGWIFTPSLPADTFRLSGGFRSGALPKARLRAARGDPPRVWFQLGRQRYESGWPDGYTVRFGKGRTKVIGPDGSVVARGGDSLRGIDLSWCVGESSSVLVY